VEGLRVQRGLRSIGGLLRLEHLLLGDLLQPVALIPGHHRLIGQALRGIAGGERRSVDGLVAFQQLVHHAQPGQEIVRGRGRPGEEQLEGGGVAPVAVQLRGDAAGLVRRVGRVLRFQVGLGLQRVGADGCVEVLLLGAVRVRATSPVRLWMRPWIRCTSAALVASFAFAACTSSQDG